MQAGAGAGARAGYETLGRSHAGAGLFLGVSLTIGWTEPEFS